MEESDFELCSDRPRQSIAQIVVNGNRNVKRRHLKGMVRKASDNSANNIRSQEQIRDTSIEQNMSVVVRTSGTIRPEDHILGPVNCGNLTENVNRSESLQRNQEVNISKVSDTTPTVSPPQIGVLASNSTDLATFNKIAQRQTIAYGQAIPHLQSQVVPRIQRSQRPLSACGALTRIESTVERSFECVSGHEVGRLATAHSNHTRRYSTPEHSDDVVSAERHLLGYAEDRHLLHRPVLQQQTSPSRERADNSIDQQAPFQECMDCSISQQLATQECTAHSSGLHVRAQECVALSTVVVTHSQHRLMPDSLPGFPRATGTSCGPDNTSSTAQTGNRSSIMHTGAVTTFRPWEMQFTREELRQALPRRFFFSCHTKALKSAGYKVEDPKTRTGRRPITYRPQEKKEFFPNSNPPPSTERSQPQSSGVPETKEAGANSTRSDSVSIQEDANSKNDSSNSLHENATLKDDPSSKEEQVKIRKEMMIQTSVAVTAEISKRQKLDQGAGKPEDRPLVQYLTYVRDHPSEYRQMIEKSALLGTPSLHSGSSPLNDKVTANLVKLGRVFENRQRSGQDTNDVVRAAYALRPRSADPSCFSKVPLNKLSLSLGIGSKQKDSTALMGGSGGPKSKSNRDDRLRQEGDSTMTTLVENMTEMEKRRLHAEEWTRSISTDHLVHAKLQVLKDLGYEERELTQWWLAFRNCFYLRTRKM